MPNTLYITFLSPFITTLQDTYGDIFYSWIKNLRIINLPKSVYLGGDWAGFWLPVCLNLKSGLPTLLCTSQLPTLTLAMSTVLRTRSECFPDRIPSSWGSSFRGEEFVALGCWLTTQHLWPPNLLRVTALNSSEGNLPMKMWQERSTSVQVYNSF